MLSEQDFAMWAKRMGLSNEALSVVAHIRCSDPARRVGGGQANVTGRYPSRKMGVTIQFESHRVELPTVYELEHDDGVLEYWDQPNSIKLDYVGAHGRHLGVLHTPDYFVIRRTEAGWEECKTEEELIRLSERNPNRYCRGDDRWLCPPGRAYAGRLGLYYRVRSAADINWLFQRNIQFLEDYLRATPEVNSRSRARILAQVAAQPGCSLADLFTATDGDVTRDEIYSLIATGDIFVDLQGASLPQPENVRVWTAFRSLGLPQSVQEHVRVKERERGYDEATFVESFVILNAAGGECPEDFKRLRADPGLAEMIGHELPSPAAALQFLYAFHADEKITGSPAATFARPDRLHPGRDAAAGGAGASRTGIWSSAAGSAVPTSASPPSIRTPPLSKATNRRRCPPTKGRGVISPCWRCGPRPVWCWRTSFATAMCRR